MEQIPDFKSLGAYCVCQITGDDFQIEVRTKIGKTRIEERVTLEQHTLIMKSECIPTYTRWAGIPAE